MDRRTYLQRLGASVAVGGTGVGTSSGAGSDTVAEGGPANRADWTLAFEDRFDDGSLDTDEWSIGFGWGRETASSYERIVDRNVRVEDGRLKLTATHDGGPESVYAGGVNTRNKRYFGPGSYWEAKLRAPDRRGWLPAFWSEPNSGVWPPEIDFFELLGNDPGISHHNVHYDASGEQGGAHAELELSYPGVVSTTDPHVYGCVWRDDRVEMYVDGRRVGVHDDPTAMASLRTGAPFYMMLNIHVGKTGEPDFGEPWGEEMAVDWVRVWERK
ncbi:MULTISPECIES: glycoside hydrolase family 16 protein [Halorussus]|uniref:glycoside hydrolase family 16 protein n=1 Tax=Halorussus TaxID=1070314 RepID=UPI00209E4102|nr:glycoside hydrolase family 16 protein [Halorussus vallis]USZ77445.1 glycoside hydrolase family 16 protein [Halorussus vallis]